MYYLDTRSLTFPSRCQRRSTDVCRLHVSPIIEESPAAKMNNRPNDLYVIGA